MSEIDKDVLDCAIVVAEEQLDAWREALKDWSDPLADADPDGVLSREVFHKRERIKARKHVNEWREKLTRLKAARAALKEK